MSGRNYTEKNDYGAEPFVPVEAGWYWFQYYHSEHACIKRVILNLSGYGRHVEGTSLEPDKLEGRWHPERLWPPEGFLKAPGDPNDRSRIR